MRNKLAILFVLMLCGISVFSQGTVITPKSVKLVPNAVNKFDIAIAFHLDMGEEEIDPDFWIDSTKRPEVSIHYGDQKAEACPLSVSFSVFPEGVSFIVSGFNEDRLNRFLNRDKDNQIKLVFESDISIGLRNPDAVAKVWIIPAGIANKMINEQLTITSDERLAFLTNLNNFFYYDNKLDFGVVPGTDDANTQYILSIKSQNVYNRSSLFKCTSDSKKLSIYWGLDSRLSTNFSDSLNYIKLYPINLLWENFKADKKIPFQFIIKVGNESSQDFVNKRATTDMSMNFIIPNFINLTTPVSNRLRLKPVISAGIKGYYDYSNGIDAFTSGQPFLNGHYYIPVFNNYAIIFDGGIFYDLSDERNPDKKIMGNYSITLGAEIPNTGFKAMFKYVDGETDINFKQGSIISIGLLMDLFQEQTDGIIRN